MALALKAESKLGTTPAKAFLLSGSFPLYPEGFVPLGLGP